LLILVQLDLYCDAYILPSLAGIDFELLVYPIKTFMRPKNFLPTDFIFEANCPWSTFG